MKSLLSVVAVLFVLLLSCPAVPGQLGSRKYPRPTFEGPTHIPAKATALAFWGDDETTGWAADWIYVSNDKIHQLIFQMPPGAFYRSSDKRRVIFGADEVWYVLGGMLAVNNPETGEMHIVNTGEAVFWRKDTWHHGFSYGTEPVKVIEFFAPPPATGTTGAYSQSKPFLKKFKEGQDELIGRWPMAQAEAQRNFTMKVMREPDLLWRVEGQSLVGLYASTEHLTAGKMLLMPGQRTELHTHAGDESVYLLEGTLTANTPKSEGQQMFILQPADGFYVPAGTPHQYVNMTESPVRLLFGVAPKYFSEEKKD